MPRLQASNATAPVLDSNGDPVSGAVMIVYQNKTTTPVSTYSDIALTIPLNPITANSFGVFPEVNLLAGIYTIRIETAAGVLIDTTDDNVVYGTDPTDPVVAKYSTPVDLRDSTNLGYSEGGSVTTVVVAGDRIQAGPYFYTVADAAATDQHLTINSVVKLYAEIGSHGALEPEQLFYDPSQENLGAVCQIAADAGYYVQGNGASYVTSSTVLWKAYTGFRGSQERRTIITASAGFYDTIFDTYGYDTLVAANSGEGEYDGPEGGVDPPVATGLVFEDFAIVGNKDAYSGTPAVGFGYGIRLYTRQCTVRNIRISRTAGPAILSNGPDTGTPTVPFHPDQHSIVSIFENIFISDTLYEGVIYKGPRDTRLDNIVVGTPANSLVSSTYNAAARSVHYTSDTIDGFVLDNCSIQGGFLHSFLNAQGWAFRVRSETNAVRLRFENLQVAESFGNMYMDSQVRYELPMVETHNCIGGDGSRPHVLDESTVGGLINLYVFRGGVENGSDSAHLAGSGGSTWEVKHQNNANDGGHGVVVSGSLYTVVGYAENMTGTNWNGEASAGLVMTGNPTDCNIEFTSNTCNVGMRFDAHSSAYIGCQFNLNSIENVTAYAGLTNLPNKVWRENKFQQKIGGVPRTNRDKRNLTIVGPTVGTPTTAVINLVGLIGADQAPIDLSDVRVDWHFANGFRNLGPDTVRVEKKSFTGDAVTFEYYVENALDAGSGTPTLLVTAEVR